MNFYNYRMPVNNSTPTASPADLLDGLQKKSPVCGQERAVGAVGGVAANQGPLLLFRRAAQRMPEADSRDSQLQLQYTETHDFAMDRPGQLDSYFAIHNSTLRWDWVAPFPDQTDNCRQLHGGW